MGKSKETPPPPKKKIVDLHKSGECLGATSKSLKVHKIMFTKWYTNINTMGPRSLHTTQEEDSGSSRGERAFV